MGDGWLMGGWMHMYLVCIGEWMDGLMNGAMYERIDWWMYI